MKVGFDLPVKEADTFFPLIYFLVSGECVKICKIEECGMKHKGHGYCQSHLEKSKRGTLDKYP